MGAEANVGAAMLLPVPERLKDQVAYDSNNSTLYVEKSSASNPELLTWLARCEDAGMELTIQRIDSDQLAKLRADGLRVHDRGEDIQLDNLTAAVNTLSVAGSFGTSDVHYLIKGKHAEVQLEVNGGLKVFARPQVHDVLAQMQAIFQGLATERDTQWKPLEFQNATISGEKFPPASGISSARVVRGPCYPQHEGAQFMSVRLQYYKRQESNNPALGKMEMPRAPEGEFALLERGYAPEQIEKVQTLMAYSTGATFVSGRTGAGKSQTIFDIMQERARQAPDQRQVGVEDPVENPQPWMVQLSVNNTTNDADTGRAFADRIRVMLRMAPKHLMVGEIRGPAAAHAAIEAAITGHSVIASLHMPDPFLFVERIASMDRKLLDPKSFCDHHIIRGSIAQALVPVLCPKCAVPAEKALDEIPHRILSPLKTWGSLATMRLKGPGCEHCGGEGTKGRTAVAEVVLTDSELMKDLLVHGSEVARRNYRKRPDADLSMLRRAMKLVLEGNVDPRAVEKAITPIVSEDIAE